MLKQDQQHATKLKVWRDICEACSHCRMSLFPLLSSPFQHVQWLIWQFLISGTVKSVK